MAQPTEAPSLLEYGIEQHYPVQLLHASQWGSGSLETCVYRSGPSLNWSVKPAAAEDTLGLVLKGESTLTRRVGRKTERQFLFTGALVLIPNQVESELKWTGTDEWLHFFINPIFKARLTNEVLDRDPARLELNDRFLFADPFIVQVGQCLVEEMRTPRMGHLYVDSLAQSLVLHLLRGYASVSLTQVWREPRGKLAPQLVGRIKDYVLANLSHNPKLEDVAREVNLSTYYLTRLFKRTTGITVHHFVMQKRVEAAREWLLTTDLPLCEIASRAGFTDQSHFTNSFKHLMHVTPGEFVQQSKNLQNRRKNLQDA